MLEPDVVRLLVTDEQRMTSFGTFLRSYSLDELPTLWNVVMGDMSLVGPRPLLVRYLDRYSPSQRRRHEVRPGITGLAQVSGRNAIAWKERIETDVRYVDQRSLSLDMRILVLTVGSVLRRDGISDSVGPTMTEFLGPMERPDA
jgi:lipopolysaccharide/colanic/teichoic acid biosynthesis glycosyltransferase